MEYIIATLLGIILISIILRRNYEEEIREEKSLSIEEILSHGEGISKEKKRLGRFRGNEFTNRFRKSYKNIYKNYIYLDSLSRKKKQIVPSGEWILENLYMIEKEYKGVLESLKNSTLKEIPFLENGKPRIFNIVDDYVFYRDGEIDVDLFITYIDGFQKESYLSIKEIMLIPIIVKVALISNISRVSDKISYIQREKIKGEEEGEKLLIRISEDKYDIDISKVWRGNKSKYFLVSMGKVFREFGVEGNDNYYSLLDKFGISYEDYISQIIEDNQEEAMLKVKMGSLINSIRIAEGLDIKVIFNRLSKVDTILKKDPSKIYSSLDSESQDYYRLCISNLSKKSKVDEDIIASKALYLCEKYPGEELKNHVGYYLFDEGKKELLESLGKRKITINKSTKVNIYIFTNIIGTVLLSFILIYYLSIKTNFSSIEFIAQFLVILLPVSEIINSIFNWSINNLTKPTFIPKLDIKGDIPKEYKTVVVIPAIVKDKIRGKELVESLETYYLANESENLYFALLGDYKDFKSKDSPEDIDIRNSCINYILELNQKYKKKEKIFYFLCRERKYNKNENIWLGWERKRGKLVEFNHLIRGDKNTSYNVFSSDIDPLIGANYIITLDADTFLGRGVAKKLIGAMAHPLNRPIIDFNKRIIRGYGIMQPRITVSTMSSNKTPYSKIFSGETGFDIYTTAISDVYMDTFKEGIFTGKGIYNVDTFNKILDGEISENKILSHDLLEGCYVRTALLTDVKFVDGYPAYYNSGSMRLHRWVRGDWQLIKYLRSSKLNKISKWKIFDNLRRSLICPSIISLLIISFAFFQNKGIFIGIAFVSLLFPIIFDVSETVVTPIKGIGLSGDVTKVRTIIEQFFLIFSFVPFQAYLMSDAIIRTLYRVFISKKRLLEWQTAEDTEKIFGREIESFIRLMWPGTGISIFLLILSYNKSEVGFIMLLPCLIFIISPYTAYYISIENREIERGLDSKEIVNLRKLARESYAYFQDFVNEETKFIAPDNYQEEPNRNIAMRTSPTNIGMTLMANIVAYDMGYIGCYDLLERLSKTIETMKKLSMYNGHFYNWYDLEKLQPLYPKYVSTVDSGNLAGYFMIISKTLEDIKREGYFNYKIFEGINDTVKLANDEMMMDILPLYIKGKNIEEYLAYMKNIRDIINEKNISSYWTSKLLEDIKKYEKELKEIKINGDKIDYSSSISNSIDEVKGYIDNTFQKMSFKMLYNKNKELFSIGYNLEKNILDNCYYDLLASEARQTSFIAIAKGEVESKHWFRLGRATSLVGKKTIGVVSWSGTMFEYFMPLLIMKNYNNSLLDSTYSFVLYMQKEYCKKKNIPWGISESAFYDFDFNSIYQYKAFGVPGVGLKRGLSNELVVSPYSSILALMIDKKGAYSNLNKLIQGGAKGKYGFYEAIDYTHRLKINSGNGKVVKCFMVHHLGMSLLSLDNVINNNIMQSRFHSIPRVKATELLLQERVPSKVIYNRKKRDNKEYGIHSKDKNIVRNYSLSMNKDIETLLLSNGKYSVMISNSGSGWSKNDKMFFYRWKLDSVKNDSGYFFYIRDIEEDSYYSPYYLPVCKDRDKYKAIFSLHLAEFIRRDKNITTSTKIIVSPEDNVELRKIKIENNGAKDLIFEITSYMEITLSNYNSDLAHPAFSNLFINTEYDEENQTLISKRRKREEDKGEDYLFHSAIVEGMDIGNITYETSRLNFIGRGRTYKNPMALLKDNNLKNTVGPVLDPIFSIRKRVKIVKNKSVTITFITAYGGSKKEGISLIKKYRDVNVINKSFILSKIQNEIELNESFIKPSEANLYQLLGSKIIFQSSLAREVGEYIKKIVDGQETFWKKGISGDYPIVTFIYRSEEGMFFLRQLIQAFNYLNSKGLIFDLVIEVKDENTYEHVSLNKVNEEVNKIKGRIKKVAGNNIFVISEDSIDEDFRNLLYGSSRLLLNSNMGNLINSIRRDSIKEEKKEILCKLGKNKLEYKFNLKEVSLFNGYGGFNKEDNSYRIILDKGENTPMPWINVISNEHFGTVISELGGSYTFNKNSRENKISSWSNDIVTDGEGELLYIRDDEDYSIGSVFGKIDRDQGEYIIEHGFGYSKFYHYFMDLICEVTTFIPRDTNAKISIINIKNNQDIERKLSIAYYVDLVMGVYKEKTTGYITTDIDEKEGYIYGVNPYNHPFNEEIAYLKISPGKSSFSGRREEFLGRYSDYNFPKGLGSIALSNNVGAGVDPCLSSLSSFSLKGKGEINIVLILGEEDSKEKIKEIINKYNEEEYAFNELNKVKEYWKKINKTILVETEDEAFNFLLNGPLLYQTLSCRIWGRTGFYQCGGAYGFRDQLQDVMALHYILPELEKKQILLCASRQYEEGDVQHWWHPYVNSGIRTKFSDDLLWLPYVVIDYIKATGDYNILKEEIGYLKDEPLGECEDERYNKSKESSLREPLINHIIKAIDKSLKYGSHNIPLMGSGDWNDGMNTVGNKGKGESVWLGFFICSILKEIIPILEKEEMKSKAIFYEENLRFIIKNIEENAWDGSWYRRAYFDDGTPIGSISCDECKIDSISQSWAIISGVSKKERMEIALDSVEKNLYYKDKGILLLLTPPFNKGEKEPGYIKGYLPGIRENGGQYTHAAVWVVMSEILSGRRNIAYEMFCHLNPINHCRTKFESDIYMVEPYVMTADIYSKEPHVGRGGWSFYTGASGWMYRTAIEGILGFKIEENKMILKPCIPDSWKGFKLEYKTEKYDYKIEVKRSDNKGMYLDGEKIEEIILEEGKAHKIDLII